MLCGDDTLYWRYDCSSATLAVAIPNSIRVKDGVEVAGRRTLIVGMQMRMQMDVPYRPCVFLPQSTRYHDYDADSRPKMATMKRPTVLAAIRPELTVMEDHDDPRSTTVIQQEPQTAHKLPLLQLLLLSVFSIRAPPHHPWPLRKQTCGLEPEIAQQRIGTAQRSIFTLRPGSRLRQQGALLRTGCPESRFPPGYYLAATWLILHPPEDSSRA